MTAKATTDAAFKADVLDQDRPVLVDFWAKWCGPCRMMSRTIDEIAVSHAASLAVVKLDIDENPATTDAYGVMSVPSLLVFRNGEVVKTIVGAKAKGALLRELEAIL